MTEQFLPHWDLADRLNKSLRISGLSVQQIADRLECHRNTVGGWLNNRNMPFPASLQMWAQITGVPYEWLRSGQLAADPPPDLITRLGALNSELSSLIDDLRGS